MSSYRSYVVLCVSAANHALLAKVNRKELDMLTITSAKVRFACFFALVALASTSANAQLVRGSMSIEDLETTSLQSTGKFVLSVADSKTTSSVFSVKASLFTQDVIANTQDGKRSPVVDNVDITGVALAEMRAIKELPLIATKKRFKFTSL